MAQKRLALNINGEMTYCSASEENIGKGRCNHVEHQRNNETQKDFMIRIEQKEQNNVEILNEKFNKIAIMH